MEGGAMTRYRLALLALCALLLGAIVLGAPATVCAAPPLPGQVAVAVDPPPAPPAVDPTSYVPSGLNPNDLSPLGPLTNVSIRLPAQEPGADRERSAQLQSEAGSLAAPPEIAALAAGLGNDPRLIYEYVRNEYDTVPTWGLMRSSLETVATRSGNPFELAELLGELLQAAGYEVHFVFGTVRIPGAQAMSWVGLTSIAVLPNVFWNGGIPAAMDGNVLRIDQVWVKVNVGGTWYALDPSFKAYTALQGLNLAGVMGYDRNAFLNAAASGSTVTDQYVSGINEGNINAGLAGYANNLLQYMRVSAPQAPLSLAIGGRAIVPQTAQSLPAALPYTVENPWYEGTSIPASYLYRVRVQVPGIDYVATLPDVVGRRLTLFYRGATPADQQAIANAGSIYNVYPAYNVLMVPELRLDGALVGSGSPYYLGTWEPITVTIQTPISIGGGQTWQPYYAPQSLHVGAWYALPLSLERVTPDSLRRQAHVLEEARASGAADGSEAVLGQSLHTLGLAYFAQLDSSNELVARLAGVVRTPLFEGMIMSQDVGVTEWEWRNGAWWAKRLGVGAYTIDVRLNYAGVLGSDGNSNRERAYWTDAGHKSSAIEQATIEQLQGNAALSSIKVFDLANDSGYKIYRIITTTVDSVLPLLDYPDYVKTWLRNDVQAGYEVFVPERNVTLNQWTGMAWLTLDRRSGSSGYWISGSLGSAPAEALQVRQNGGSGSHPGTVNPGQLQGGLNSGTVGGTGCTGCNDPAGGGTNNVGGDPVDAATGAFVHSVRGLDFGALGQPLEFDRSYVSNDHRQDGPMGYGWAYSYQRTLVEASNWARAFGYRSPEDAVVAIAETFASTDAAAVTPGGLTLLRLVAGTESVDWTLAQVLSNTVTISVGGNARQFVRLPDASYVPQPGDYATLTRNPDKSYTLVEKDGTRSDFGSGRATRLADANGNQTTLSYDGTGKLTRVQNAAGQRIDLTYTGNRLTQVTDSGGRTLRFAYDGAGNLQTATDVRGGTTTYTYDSAHRVLSVTDAQGITHTTNVYDSLGRVVQQTDGRGGVTVLRYGDVRTMVADPLGQTAIYRFDRYGRLVSRRDALGLIESLTYDAHDDVLSRADGLGRTTTYAYDARGNLVSRTWPTGESASYAYDAQNNLTSSTDELGHTTTYVFDAHRNPVHVTDALGHATSVTYNALGLPVNLTDANGHITAFSYDASGNLTQTVNALGQATTLAYDAWNRVLSVTAPSGARTQYAYDAAGNVTQRTDPLSNATHWAYDGNGLPTSMTDARGHVTHYAYDAQLNLTGVTDALGNVTHYAYDGNGRLSSVTDANGHTMSYTRDARGQATAVTDPLNRELHYTYDAAGEVLTRTRADGHVTSYQYDTRGRLTAVQLPGDVNVTLAYGATGLVDTVTAPDGPVHYTYDALGQTTRVDRSDGLAVSYSHDPAGNLLCVQAQRAGASLYDAQYTYDAASRLNSASDAISGQAASYTYNNDGYLTGVDYASGAKVRYTRDAARRITRVDNTGAGGRALSTFAYTIDATGNPTQIVRSGPGAPLTVNYSYDNLDRLTREAFPRYNVDYAYDAVGNRLSVAGPQGTTSNTYDAADQLLSAGGVTFTYDANGNRTGRVDARGAYALAYDAQNRLVSITAPGGATTTFGYDWLGNRTQRTGPEGNSLYAYAGPSMILEEQGGGQGAAYVYGAAGLALGRELGATGLGWSYAGDALGSVMDLADNAGNLRAAYGYDAYGRQREAAGAANDPYRFIGQLGVRAEAAIPDLYLMGRRYYDAGTGAFLSRDPLPGVPGQPETLQTYGYAFDNPLRFVDPNGLRAEPPRYVWLSFSELSRTQKLIYVMQYGQYVAGISGPPSLYYRIGPPPEPPQVDPPASTPQAEDKPGWVRSAWSNMPGWRQLLGLY
jgi:RHS repeat-associated protein